jgi:hypothetical protein
MMKNIIAIMKIPIDASLILICAPLLLLFYSCYKLYFADKTEIYSKRAYAFLGVGKILFATAIVSAIIIRGE